MTYTTLDRVSDELKGTEAKKAAGTDQQLMGYVRTVTSRILTFKFEFEPYYDVKPFTSTPANVDSQLSVLSLDVDAPLLEVKSIVVNNITVAFGTDILPYPNTPQTPIRALRIAHPRTGPLRTWYPSRFTNCEGFIENVVITGYWGIRTMYSRLGFFDSGQTCPALDNVQTVFAVTSVAGPDVYDRSPLFSPGNLIRIEDELMDVVSVDPVANDLTVLRGVRGTASVSHSATLPIRIWEPEEDVANMATRQAALLYARKGSFQQIKAGGIVVSYPPDLLDEIRNTVQRFNFV